jgi:hypothetical protein
MSLTGTAAAPLILFATKRVEMAMSAATDCSILDAGQARSQDLLANRAMPILSSHADEEANNCVKKIIFRPSGQPGQFCGQTGHCPGLPMPGYGPDAGSVV